jgi:hypothetical protein
MAGQLPSARELLISGTRQELEAAIRARGERGAGRGRRSSITDLRRAWNDSLRPAWKAAVLAGNVPGLEGAQWEFEKQLLKAEDDRGELMFPRGGDDTRLLNEVYWASGYAEPATLRRATAEAVTTWAAERRTRIVEWGRNSAVAEVRAAAEKIGPAPELRDEPPRPLSRRTAAERALFYRRVLAAWHFLEAMDARAALAELQTLLEIERLPVRPQPVLAQAGQDQGVRWK